MTVPSRIVVVGASLAGLRCVEALRRRGYEGALCLVGEEPHRPYDRPPLSKQLLTGEWPTDKVFFRQKDGYDPLGLELVLGRRATRLDTGGRAVVLDDGQRLAYEAVVVATGARPRSLPGAPPVPGMHVLRTLDDAVGLAEALERRPRVVLVGAGFIGLEVAAACRSRDLDVAVVDPLDPPLAPAIGAELGEVVAALHRERGVDVRCGVSVQAIRGDARVEAVALSDGSELDADVVVVGIGVTPNTEWLDGSGVPVDDGVVCDATGATSVAGVYAAGDVARWCDASGNGHRFEHWTSAVEQANAVAGRILEGPEVKVHATAPYFWSDQFDRKIQFVGRCPPDHRVHWRENDRDGGKVVALLSSGDRLVGAFCIGRPRELIRFRMMLGKGASIDEALAVD